MSSVAVHKEPSGLHPVLALIVAVVVVFAAALVGNIATFGGLVPWYAGLEKPAFNPPNWVFGPVWSLLYLLMIAAFWRVLTRPKATSGRSAAIVLFVVQMALNGAWSIAFFGLQSPLLGLVTIAALIIALLATVITVFRVDRLAGSLLVPYLAWVSFASVLNGAVWWLNR